MAKICLNYSDFISFTFAFKLMHSSVEINKNNLNKDNYCGQLDAHYLIYDKYTEMSTNV